jgi:hypothetical protein
MNAFDPRNPGMDFFKPSFQLLKIISSASITGQSFRWEYSLQVVEFDGADLRSTPAYEDRGAQIKGFNVLEFDNTLTNAGGYDPDNIPDDFSVKPISGYVLGHPLNAKVDNTFETVFLFSAVNPIDGECA